MVVGGAGASGWTAFGALAFLGADGGVTMTAGGKGGRWQQQWQVGSRSSAITRPVMVQFGWEFGTTVTNGTLWDDPIKIPKKKVC